MTRPTYSFDVFDTLLTRIHATPDDVHLHLAEVLLGSGLVTDASIFVVARRQAEHWAWRSVGYRRAIAIEDIYLHLANAMAWSEGQAAQAMQQEVDIESAAVRPVASGVRQVRRYRAAGARICYVSDMHLRECHLRQMLQGASIFDDHEKVFVSSEFGATKRGAGRLYEHVLRDLGIARWRLVHTGDDARADVLMAAVRGVRWRHRPQARLNRYECVMLDALPKHDWRTRSIVSASKFARLEAPTSAIPEAAWQLLCSTIAPFVAGYALWLIGEAQRRGLHTLLFLARDMQIVHEVASELVSALGLPLRCVYLNGSRAAWQKPSFSADPDYDLFWLTDQVERNDPRAALRRLLSDESVEKLDRDGLLDQRAGEATRDALCSWLDQQSVRACVDMEVKHAREVLGAYLAQQGFKGGDGCALVDGGWRGTLQKCLSRALSVQAGGTAPSVLGFYIGLRHRVSLEPGCEMHAFLPDSAVSQSGYALVSLVEGLLTADHGTTLGYDRTADGSVRPRLGPPPTIEVLSQARAVRECCVTYVRKLINLPAFVLPPETLTSALAAPFLELCTQPTPADAAALRGWRIDVGRGEEPRLNSVARKLSVVDMAKLVLYKLRSAPEGDVYLSGPWTRGSIAASHPAVRIIAKWLLTRRAP